MKFTKNKIPYNISKDILQEQLQEQLQASVTEIARGLTRLPLQLKSSKQRIPAGIFISVKNLMMKKKRPN